MRLTLRTLLAWIDALLGPDDQRSLGEKVAASEVAPRLAARIGEVVANPAIAAPPPDGRGLADDPNVAAEFLDNVLEPDRLEAFERVCIESDVHLADVASCHGILAETIRDPACIEPLEPARARAALEAARKSLRESTSASEQIQIDTSAPRSRDRRDVPPPSRRTPLAAWLSAAVAFLLLLGLAGFLVWSLLRPPRAEPRHVAEQPAVIPPRDVQDHRPENQPLAEPAPPPVPDDNTAAAPAAGVDPASELPQVDPRPPAAVEVATVDQPDAVQPQQPPPAAPVASPPERSVPFGDALAIGGGAADSSPEPAGQAPAEPPSAPRTEKPGARGVPAIVEGAVLIRSAVEQGGWLAATAAAPLADGPGPWVLLAPAWTYPLVGIDAWLVRLHPGTMVTLLTTGDGMPRLEITTGRVVAVSAGADLRFAVAAGGLDGVVAGPPGMPVGIEVSATRQPQDAAAVLRATIHAGGGAISWRQAAADGQGRPLMGVPLELLIPQSTALCWDGGDPAAATLVTETEPGWMRAVASVDRPLRRAAAELVAALSAAAEAPPSDVLRRELMSGRPENRMAAAATLALLGDNAALADLLCEEPPRGLHEGQWLALEEATVPVIVARGGKESESLLDALRERTPAEDAAEVVALARNDEAAEPAEARGLRLVDDLDSASLVVRRFAILRLRETVPPARRLSDDYRADRPESLRAESVASWREVVSRPGGKAEIPQAAPVPRRQNDE